MILSYPVTALVWDTWRMSRRWYIWVLLVALAIGFVIISNRPPTLPESTEIKLQLAIPAFMLIFILSCMATLLAMAVGNREGFPFNFEFRLPVSTFLLVSVPMVFLCVLCASLFFVPILLIKLVYDIPYAIFPASALIATTVALVVAGTWASTSTWTRSILIMAMYTIAITLFGWLDPVHMERGNSILTPLLITGIISLTHAQYGILVLVFLVSLGTTIYCVSRQRKGETSNLSWPGKRRLPDLTRNIDFKGTETKTGKIYLETFMDWLAFPCPESPEWLAEVWIEIRRFSIPVILLSIFLALAIPCMFMVSNVLDWKGLKYVAASSSLVVFFTGIGISVFNRRQANSGYMNVFEGTRAMTTGKLAIIQIMVIAMTTLMGIVLVETSLGTSQLMFAGNWTPRFSLRDYLPVLGTDAPMQFLTRVVMVSVVYVTTMAMFSCLHSCSVFWGRKFMIGTLGLVFYAINILGDIYFEDVELEIFQAHMWGITGLVGVVSLLSTWRVLRLKIISQRTFIYVLLAWLLFFVCSLYNLVTKGMVLTDMAPELLAMRFSFLLLPLTFLMTTFWCYDRLRHT